MSYVETFSYLRLRLRALESGTYCSFRFHAGLGNEAKPDDANYTVILLSK